MIQFYVLYEYHAEFEECSGQWTLAYIEFGSLAEAKAFITKISGKQRKKTHRLIAGPLVKA